MWHFYFIRQSASSESCWQSFSDEGNRAINQALSQEPLPRDVTWWESAGLHNDAVYHVNFETMLMSRWSEFVGATGGGPCWVRGMFRDPANPYVHWRTFNYAVIQQMAILRYRERLNFRDGEGDIGLSLIHI